jgi:optic atrophy 3 protein
MWSLNLGSPAAVPRLNEAMAIDLGANLLGETIIFITAAGILIFEYSRSSRKDHEKQQQLQVIDLQIIINGL